MIIVIRFLAQIRFFFWSALLVPHLSLSISNFCKNRKKLFHSLGIASEIQIITMSFSLPLFMPSLSFIHPFDQTGVSPEQQQEL